MVEDVGPRGKDGFEGPLLAQKIRRQDLDRRRRRTGADRQNGAAKMLRAAVSEIVTIDRGNDDMGKAELGHGIGNMFWFVGIERARQTGLHVTEGAGPRAGIAQDHEGRVLLFPAFADIRAAGLFADGHKAVFTHDLAGFGP